MTDKDKLDDLPLDHPDWIRVLNDENKKAPQIDCLEMTDKEFEDYKEKWLALQPRREKVVVYNEDKIVENPKPVWKSLNPQELY